MRIKSAYIHIPFCKTICAYCDFCKIYYNDKFISNYLEALNREINLYYKNELLDTLYIGGGTPSCLNKFELEKLFKIIKKLNFSSNLEFTFECNINDINEELLIFLKKNKVNRLSIGVESFNDKVLNILGRKNYDTINKLNLCKKFFNNINIDLIYGVNGQSIKDLKEDLKLVLNESPNHISIYSLILENNTVLKTNGYIEQDEDLTREMYDFICSTLRKHGYIHYEISNFSKGGYESKHNLTYWNNDEYYGFGLGASGYVGNKRYSNTRSITNYLKGNYRVTEEIITKEIDMENFMILGLRKLEGVSNFEFKERYGKNINEVFNTNKLDKENDRYFINENDLFVSNSILIDFINIV